MNGKNIFLYLVIILLIFTKIIYAKSYEQDNVKLDKCWIYNFDSILINELKILKWNKDANYSNYENEKNSGNINFVYNGRLQKISDFSKECVGVNLIQRNGEDLIEQLPDNCYILFTSDCNYITEYYYLIRYLCSNRGCNKVKEPFECIENDERDCGF